MKVYNEYNFNDLRDFVCKTIDSIFGIEQLLDIIDYDKYACALKYDFIRASNEEFYIINRQTGEYINWYKYTHIGRDINMNFNPKRLKKFLIDLKKECEKWEERYENNN